jgi:hypothetical protein
MPRDAGNCTTPTAHATQLLCRIRRRRAASTILGARMTNAAPALPQRRWLFSTLAAICTLLAVWSYLGAGDEAV